MTWDKISKNDANYNEVPKNTPDEGWFKQGWFFNWFKKGLSKEIEKVSSNYTEIEKSSSKWAEIKKER